MLRCGCALSIGGGVLEDLGVGTSRAKCKGFGAWGRFQNTQLWPRVLFRVPKCCAVQDSQGDRVKAKMLAMQRKPGSELVHHQ